MISSPITYPAIQLPRRRTGLLTRPRLLETLFAQLESRLILLVAPAGYGKTTLLVDFAHQCELPVGWYSIDGYDREPGRFLAHFIAALHRVFPNFGRASNSALLNLPAGPFDPDPLVTVIVNELYEHVPEQFVLVLDDYHLVQEQAEIHAFIQRFIRRVGENCHLVLASRRLIELPDLPLLLARGQAGRVAVEALAFTPAEIQALVLQNFGRTISDDKAAALWQATEGWIAALLLSAQQSGAGMLDRLHLAQASEVGISEYLAQEFLNGQPEPVQLFLLRSALLDTFDADLCAQVFGPAVYPGGADWDELVATVRRSNLLVQPAGAGDTRLRYHPLLRDHLRRQAPRRLPGEPALILRRLVDYYRSQGAWEPAHDACERLGEPEITAGVIDQAGTALIQAGQAVILSHWLAALPDRLADTHPGLLSLRGVLALLNQDIPAALPLLDRAVAAFDAGGDLPGLARALVRRSNAHRFRGEHPACLQDAAWVLQLTEGDPALQDLRAHALNSQGLSLRYQAQPQQAVAKLQAALAIYQQLGDAYNIANVWHNLGIAANAAGDFHAAQEAYDRSLEHWRQAGYLHRLADLQNDRGMFLGRLGRYAPAIAALDEAIRVARQCGYLRGEAFALCNIGNLYAELEALQAAQQAWDRSREIAGRIPLKGVLFYLDLHEGLLAGAAGDFARARRLLAAARQNAAGREAAYELGLCDLEDGRLALAAGDPTAATRAFERGEQVFRTGGWPGEERLAALYLAAAAYQAGDSAQALDWLASVFEDAARLQPAHELILAGRQARGVLELACQHPGLKAQAAALLDGIRRLECELPALRSRVRRQVQAVPFGPPGLVIRALGEPAVTVEGQPLGKSDWQSAAAGELFFYLLAHPGRYTIGDIGLVLWPDKSPEKLKAQFKSTIYRLRQALDRDVVLHSDDHYTFNRLLDYEYDVDLFLDRLEQARSAGDPEQRAGHLRAVLELYRQDYLLAMEGSWVEPERQRLRQAWIDAALSLAEHHLEKDEFPTSLQYCDAVLHKDPCQETAHRLAMRAHAGLGTQAGIIRQYNLCCQALEQVFGVPPSQQTERLYQALIRQ